MYSFAGDEAMRPFLRRPIHFEPFRYPYPFDVVETERGAVATAAPCDHQRQQGASAHVNELYCERLRAIAYFEARGEVDLYGVGWDGPAFRIGETRVPRRLRRLGYLRRATLGHGSDPTRSLATARRAPGGDRSRRRARCFRATRSRSASRTWPCRAG